MQATIVGLERVNYTKKDGTDVKAHNIYLSRDDSAVVGQACETAYLSDDKLRQLKLDLQEKDYHQYIGATANIDYNSRGFLIGFDILLDE